MAELREGARRTSGRGARPEEVVPVERRSHRARRRDQSAVAPRARPRRLGRLAGGAARSRGPGATAAQRRAHGRGTFAFAAGGWTSAPTRHTEAARGSGFMTHPTDEGTVPGRL